MAGVKGQRGEPGRVGTGPRRRWIKLSKQAADRLYQIVRWYVAGDDTPDRKSEEERATWLIEQMISDEWEQHERHGWRQPGDERNIRMNATITGPVTQGKLQAWIDANRPELGIYENHANGLKGFYRLDLGPAASLTSCGPAWRDVAAALGGVEVSEEA